MTQPSQQRGPCPYCREAPPAARYDDREHVIPQSFGRFRENLIARNVCDACNKCLGVELDRVLARGTYEGSMRFKLGEKRPSEYQHIGAASKIRLMAKEGQWTGMHLHHVVSPNGDALLLVPAKQLGFAKSEHDEPVYFLPDDAPDKTRCAEQFGNHLFVRSIGFEDPEELKALLRTLGFTQFGEFEADWSVVTDGTTIATEQIATADRLVFRAVAKIAINYLDAMFPELSRMATFRTVCEYVRYDAHPDLRPVVPSFRPVLANEPKGQYVLGHMVALRYDRAGGVVHAIVSLYNQVRYDIVLAPTGFTIDVPPGFLTRGSFFDPKNHCIHELVNGSQLADRLLVEGGPPKGM